MSEVIDPSLVGVLLLNFFLLGTSRMRAMINISAFQGILLGTLPVLVHGKLSLEPGAISLGAILLKGFLIPTMLVRAMREAKIRREVEPIIGFLPSLLLGALATGLSLLFSQTLPLAEVHKASLL